jgi:hypothetical protein
MAKKTTSKEPKVVEPVAETPVVEEVKVKLNGFQRAEALKLKRGSITWKS